MSRLTAALAAFEPVRIDAAPATDWFRRECAVQRPGCVTVVMHSMVMPYLTGVEREEFIDVMRRLGSRATPESPLAWLRMESSADYESITLEVDLWPSHRHELLAACTPHGAEIDWLPLASRE